MLQNTFRRRTSHLLLLASATASLLAAEAIGMSPKEAYDRLNDCRKGKCGIIYVGYELPTNPDLASDAMGRESKCLNSRLITSQACQSDSRAKCEARAEVGFRRCISSIQGAEFWLAAGKGGSVTKFYRLSADQAVDSRIDDNLFQLSRANSYKSAGFVLVFRGEWAGRPSCEMYQVNEIDDDEVRNNPLRYTWPSKKTPRGDSTSDPWAPICKAYDEEF
jgi:hypothetical protein